MTLIGYTMMCEQAGPKQLVRDVALAEQAGFDFAVISDHYFPWLDSQWAGGTVTYRSKHFDVELIRYAVEHGIQ